MLESIKKDVFILDTSRERRYAFNLFTTHKYEDGTLSSDCREIMSDSLDDSLLQLKEYLTTKEELS